MTDKINSIRKQKYDSEFDKPEYYKLKGFAFMFMLCASMGWLIVFYSMMKNRSIYILHNMYLLATSTGCLVMSIAYIVLRSKLRKLDKYQEDIIDCVHYSLEMFHNHISKQGKLLKSIDAKLDNEIEHNVKLESKVDSLLYLQFRHYMCPSLDELKALSRTLEGDIAEIGLCDELYQKLLDIHVTTPLAFFKSADSMLLDGVLSDDEYYDILKTIHAQYPMINELDRVPDLLLNVSDSMKDYTIS